MCKLIVLIINVNWSFFLSIHMQKNKSVPHSLWGVVWKGTHCLNLPLCHVHNPRQSVSQTHRGILIYPFSWWKLDFWHIESLSWQHLSASGGQFLPLFIAEGNKPTVMAQNVPKWLAPVPLWELHLLRSQRQRSVAMSSVMWATNCSRSHWMDPVHFSDFLWNFTRKPAV